VTTRTPPRPPRFGRLLLRLLPLGARREEIESDLHEVFLARAATDPRLARRRYLGDVVSVGRHLGQHAREIRRVRARNRLASVLQHLGRDLRLGLRGLARNKGFAATAILSIGLGVGANTAIFSLIHALMLRTLPARAPHELVELRNHYPDPAEPRMNGFSWNFYELLRERREVFTELAGIAPLRPDVGGNGVAAEPVDALLVTDQFFPMLGIQPAIGRLIGPGDGQPGPATSTVAVLSWTYWHRRFNGDARVVGKTLTVNGLPAIVVGVAPRSLTGVSPGLRTDVWMPVAGQPGVAVLGRLNPRLSYRQAEVELSGLNRLRVEEMATRSNDPLWGRATLEVSSAATGLSVLRERLGRPLIVLMAIVGLLLGIACTNIAAILLARGASRQHEIGLRLALGASRLRVIQQVLTEALLIAFIGSLFGVAIAYFGANGLIRLLISGGAGRFPMTLDLQVEPDLTLLLFAVSAALMTGVLFGLAPARQALSFAPLSTMREIRGRNDGRTHRFFGQTVIVAQVAFSAVLLSGAALFMSHLSNLRHADLGFERRSVLLVTMTPPDREQNRAESFALYRDVLGRLEALPGVRSASLSAVTPIEGGAASRFIRVEGFEEAADARRYVMLNWVGPKYFDTFGTTRLAGRDFQFEDRGRPPVAIVNRAMARHYFGESNPIGRSLTIDKETPRYEIVGVVADAKYSDLHQPAPRTIYLNYFQSGPLPLHWALRTAVAPMAVSNEAQRMLREIAPAMRVTRVTTLADQMDKTLVTERVVATLAGFFGVVGAMLVAVGLFGLLAYTVARRTREIGIRMALGSTQAQVARLVLQGYVRTVVLGLAIGLPLALAAQRVAASLVEGVPTGNVLPIGVAALATLGVTLVAAYLPARRAASIRPVQALRHE
jgi:putative ABC transport system permease protein